MRVFVVEASAKGGLIHYSYHLCRALQRIGVDTTLVTSTAYELDNLKHEFKVEKLLHLWDPRAGKGGNPVWRKVRRGIRGAQYVAEWLRLVYYLQRQKPDVVLFGEMRFAFEVRFLKMLRGAGLKLADIVHDVRAYDTRRDAASIVLEDEKHLRQFEAMYEQFHALFVHDKTNYDLFIDLYKRVPAQNVHEIPLGTNEIVLEVQPTITAADLRKQLNIATGQKVVMFFGTVTKYKGVEDLIRAFPMIHKATGARLVIAGFPAKDIDPEALQAAARELGVYEHISWLLDYVPNEHVLPMMEISDVVALPYRAISQSAVIQIAYACGKPVVATRIGGLQDVVEDGQSGFLAEAENIQSLADACNRILSSDELAHKMGARAKVLADTRFAWKNVAERLVAAFKGL
jgi:glycosyltransferase involved in cell wall biosynthesis